MTILYEGRHPVAFILSTLPGYQSIEAVTVGASQNIQPGQILGGRVVVANATSTPSAKIGNTGNATIAMSSPALTSKAVNGRYKGIASAATKVDWEDPTGKSIGTSTHGSPFAAGGIRMQITAGGTPSAAGDEFYVDVGVERPNDIEAVAFDPTATDGAEAVIGIAMYPAKTGVGQTLKVSAIVAGAEVNAKELVLPDGISATDTAKLYADLAALGIKARN